MSMSTASKARTVTALAAASLLATAAVAPVASAAPDLTGSLGGPIACDIDPAKVAEETPGPFPDRPEVGWTVGAHNDLGSNVGYLFLETDHGTGSSPTKVLIYHNCELTPTQPTSTSAQVLGSESPMHVSVGEMKLDDGQATADATFDYTLYVWNPLAGDVVPVPLPAGVKI